MTSDDPLFLVLCFVLGAFLTAALIAAPTRRY